MKVLEVLTGTPLSRAASRRDAVRKKLAEAETRREVLALEVEAARSDLRRTVAEDEGDATKATSRVSKAVADLAAQDELLESLRLAASDAEGAFLDVARRETLADLRKSLSETQATIPDLIDKARRSLRASAEAVAALEAARGAEDAAVRALREAGDREARRSGIPAVADLLREGDLGDVRFLTVDLPIPSAPRRPLPTTAPRPRIPLDVLTRRADDAA